MATTTPDLSETVAGLSDEDLVWVLLSLMAPYDGDDGRRHPSFSGMTENGASAARVALLEVAGRWIPLDVFGAAFKRHLDDVGPDVLTLIDGGRDDAS